MNLPQKTMFGGLVALLLLSPFFIYKERRSYQCSGCLSKKHVYQWCVGIWPEFAIPISFQRPVEEKSHTLQDFAPPNHTHNWQFAQGSPYNWFGMMWAGCAIGAGGSMNEFALLYERFEDFRRFIRKKQGEGLGSQVVYQILILPKFTAERQKNDEKFLEYSRHSKELYEEYSHLSDSGVP